MAAQRKPDSEEALADLLRRAEPPVRYDLDKGYARHQQIVAEHASLP